MKISIKIIGLFLLLAVQAHAQLGIRKFSIGYSNWNRAYDGSDERVFFSSAYNPAVDFTKSAGMPTVSGELQLYKGLGLEGRLGLWKTTFDNEFTFGDDNIQERISQRIIPGSVNLLYNAEISKKFNFYAGIGVNRYFMQETSERKVSPGTGSIEPTTFTGNNYGWNNQIGLEYWFMDNFGLAIEGRQHFGSYNKTYLPVVGGEPVTTKIDLGGLEVGVSLRYRLGQNRTPKKKKEESEESPATNQKSVPENPQNAQTQIKPAQETLPVTKPEIVFESKPEEEPKKSEAEPQTQTVQESAAKQSATANPQGMAQVEPCPPSKVVQSPGDPMPLNQVPISNTYPVPAENQVPNLFKGAPTAFPLGSDQLGNNEVSMLNETAAFLKKFGQYNIIIYGHACDIGTKERNYSVSLNRANQARTLLINQGIEANRIAIVGMGAEQPKVPNTSEENRRINRRIEIFKFIAR